MRIRQRALGQDLEVVAGDKEGKKVLVLTLFLKLGRSHVSHSSLSGFDRFLIPHDFHRPADSPGSAKAAVDYQRADDERVEKKDPHTGRRDEKAIGDDAVKHL